MRDIYTPIHRSIYQCRVLIKRLRAQVLPVEQEEVQYTFPLVNLNENENEKGEREELIALGTKEKVNQNYYRRFFVKKLSSE